MARVNNLTDFLTDVAAAIKTKKGSSTVISAADFDTEILALPSQGVYQTKEVNITTNGNYEIIPDENYDAMDKLRLSVAIEGREDLTDVLNTQDEKIAELEAALENKTAGGNVKLNIYTQTTEPTDKNGIWLQTDKVAEHYISDDNIFMGGTWVPDGNTPVLPYSFRLGSATAIGTNIYLFGTSEAGYQNTAYKYDTVSGTFTRLTNIPYNFYDGAIAVIGTDIYLLGGQGGTNNFYKYNTLTDTYTQLTNIPYTFRSCGATAIGTNIYLFGGYNYGDRTKAYKYDTLTNSFSQIAYVPNGFWETSAVVTINNDAYLFGGQSGRTKAYKYSSVTNTYTLLATIPYEFFYGSTVVLGNDIYLLGGSPTSTNYNNYKYNVLTDTYTQLTNVPYAFAYGAAAIVNTSIYLFGGDNSTVKTKTQIYHAQNKTYSTDNSVVIAQGRTYSVGYNIKLFEVTDFEDDYQPLYGFADAWFYTLQDGLITNIPTYYGDGTQWIKFKN